MWVSGDEKRTKTCSRKDVDLSETDAWPCESWSGRKFDESNISECSSDCLSTRGSSSFGELPLFDEESRFKCTECVCSFENAHSLERHAKDLGHRCYVCREPGCEKSYFRRDLYARHKKSHRQVEVFACAICMEQGQQKAFKRRDHLKQHVRSSHSEIDSSSFEPQERRALQQQTVGIERHKVPPVPWSPASQILGTDIKPNLGVEGSKEFINWPDESSQDLSRTLGDCEYQSNAVKDILCQVEKLLGEGQRGHALRLLEELGFHPDSTTEQVALRLAFLAFELPELRAMRDRCSQPNR